MIRMDACDVVGPSDLALELSRHLAGPREVNFYRWTKGRSAELMPWLQIAETSIDSNVHYLSAGSSRVRDKSGYGTEFCYIAESHSCANVELVAMASYMHSLQSHRLDVGHTLSIGRPIADYSSLDRLLVSLPYPYGSEFEFAHLKNGGHVRILWLLPISASEERFRHKFGLDQLEDLLEKQCVDFSDPLREPVV